MNTHKNYGAAGCLIGICLLFVGTVLAQDTEKSVKIKDLPEIVQKTVREQSKGAKVRAISKEVENGKIYYEAEMEVKGHSKAILIAETGAVVEIEEQVALSSLPAGVKAQIVASAGKGKIKRVESTAKPGALTIYEALIIKAGRKFEITVSSDGKLIDKTKNP